MLVRICLDARKLWDSGIGTYIRGLLDGFAQTGQVLEWDFVVKPDDLALDSLSRMSGKLHQSRVRNYSISELFNISNLANKTSADLFHAPHYVFPFGLKLPLVVTVHDLIHLKFPQYFSTHKRAYARWMFRRVGRKARMILAVSECTRKDLIEILGLPPSKVFVTYVGVNQRYFQSPSEDKVRHFRQEYDLPAEYLLYVGNLKPHKNVSGLITAWARLPASVCPALVVVGARIDQYESLKSQVQQLDKESEVVFLGSLSDDMMVPLYKCAAAYVQPSWYEGFGSPPLEAMASGVPLAVSNRGSLPEITADAALVFDPADSEAMTAALEKLLTDWGLREELIRKGFERARQFTWKEVAERTLQVYQMALEAR